MKKALYNIFDICFLIISVMIFEAAFSQMIMQSFISGLIIIPIAVLFLYICIKKTDLIERINCKTAWWILRIISLILMMKFAFSLQVNFSWDWGQLIRSAYDYLETSHIDKPEYYARYPNNKFWLLCTVGLFKLLRFFVGDLRLSLCRHVTMVISVIVVQAAIELIYRTAKLIFSEKKAFFVGILAVFCLPLYLYSGFFYTDTPSVLLTSIMLYLYFKIPHCKNKSARISLYILLGFTGAIACLIKMTAIIVFVAILIAFIFSKVTLKQVLCFLLTSVLAFGITTAAAKLITKPIYEKDFGITDELSDKYEFPPSHWIMMGLGHGGYSQKDVDRTKSFDTYEGKDNFNKREIRNRINNYGFFGFVKHTFSDKVIRTFGNSALAGDDYISRRPIYKDGILSKLFSARGSLHPIGLIISWTYYAFIITGLLFSAIESVKNKSKMSKKLLVGRISIFGIFVFMLIWECTSRYLLTFCPVMIILAADGLFSLIEYSRKFLKIRHSVKDSDA